ncbi:unnamed protein product [Linum trigynum]|uniref:Uncharacterized protein n=1 Tax=Linum trigynum TaxID=586398 RepID=A0AAV2GQE2_9ROSI
MASRKFIQSHSKDMSFDVATASVDSLLSVEQSVSLELAELLLEAVERVETSVVAVANLRFSKSAFIHMRRRREKNFRRSTRRRD